MNEIESMPWDVQVNSLEEELCQRVAEVKRLEAIVTELKMVRGDLTRQVDDLEKVNAQLVDESASRLWVADSRKAEIEELDTTLAEANSRVKQLEDEKREERRRAEVSEVALWSVASHLRDTLVKHGELVDSGERGR